jgi:hypothetical protein
MNVNERFWWWFVRHEAELFDFEADQERIFDRLATELHKINSDLTFEFGPPETRREFIISAGGIKSAFPAVASLARAAPRLERWQITAFRPRRTLPNVVQFREVRVDSRDVQFSLLHNGNKAGIYLFLPDLREGDMDWQQVGYLLLDAALGEYDVEMRLGLIKILSPDAATTDERYPLIKLPELLDELASRLEGRSERPS